MPRPLSRTNSLRGSSSHRGTGPKLVRSQSQRVAQSGRKSGSLAVDVAAPTRSPTSSPMPARLAIPSPAASASFSPREPPVHAPLVPTPIANPSRAETPHSAGLSASPKKVAFSQPSASVGNSRPVSGAYASQLLRCPLLAHIACDCCLSTQRRHRRHLEVPPVHPVQSGGPIGCCGELLQCVRSAHANTSLCGVVTRRCVHPGTVMSYAPTLYLRLVIPPRTESRSPSCTAFQAALHHHHPQCTGNASHLHRRCGDSLRCWRKQKHQLPASCKRRHPPGIWHEVRAKRPSPKRLGLLRTRPIVTTGSLSPSPTRKAIVVAAMTTIQTSRTIPTTVQRGWTVILSLPTIPHRLRPQTSQLRLRQVRPRVVLPARAPTLASMEQIYLVVQWQRVVIAMLGAACRAASKPLPST